MLALVSQDLTHPVLISSKPGQQPSRGPSGRHRQESVFIGGMSLQELDLRSTAAAAAS